MDNPMGQGFKLYRGPNGAEQASALPALVIASQAFNINNGAQGIRLRQGDPIVQNSSGGVSLCDGTEGSGGAVAPFGIVEHVGPYYDSVTGRMKQADGYPSGINWGTNQDRAGYVWYIPLAGCIWEVDVDDADTAATLAAYQTLVHNNVNHILTGEVGDVYAKPKLDISTAATTNALLWRIVGISKTVPNDPAELNFKLLVKANIIADAPNAPLGV